MPNKKAIYLAIGGIALLLYIFYIYITFSTFTGSALKKYPKEDKENKMADLSVYYAIDEKEAEFIFERFHEKTGRTIEGKKLSSKELIYRISWERYSQEADVIVGGGVLTYIKAKKLGLLEPINIENSKYILPKFKDPDNAWFGLYVDPIAFASYKNSLVLPRRWINLLDKNIEIVSPLNNEFRNILYITLSRALGEKRGKMLFESLIKNKRTSEESKNSKEVIYIGFFSDLIKSEKREKLNIYFPREGTGWRVIGSALIKGAKHTDVAKEFLNFLLSTELQKEYKFPTNSKFNFLNRIRLIDLNFYKIEKTRNPIIGTKDG